MGILNKVKGIFIKEKPSIEFNFLDMGLFDQTMELGDLPQMIKDMKNEERKSKQRIPVKPIDIIHDLEKGVSFSKDNIDEAIKEMKNRIAFMEETLESCDPDEMRALAMLEARKKYPKYAHMFRWKTTTEEHIQTLCDKYELDHKPIREYIRSVPKGAIESMRVYAKIHSMVSPKKPYFSVIAPPSYFADPRNKSDPILLASSPFGKYYFILTAWDKEIGIVSELLDGEELIIEDGEKRFKKVKEK